MSRILNRIAVAAVAGLGLVSLGGCDLGPKTSTQTGYRGAGLQQITDVAHVAKMNAVPAPPYPLPPDGGALASASYSNLKVLGGVSKDRFDHLMAEMNQWVAPPAQGCNYCHNPENMASDEKYTKVVARRMLQMTMNINSRWSTHVKTTGVTCYTCHRGNGVPDFKWAVAEGSPNPGSILGNKRGQNSPNPNVGYTALPYDPYAEYLNGAQRIRVAGNSAFPSPDSKVSVQDTEKTYGLMMSISAALGVNCTYCHNTQSFRAWNLSRAQRGTAYYGIRMVRDINEAYLGSLQAVFPAYRKGPRGDVFKVNCQTCHQGASKPLNGASMIAEAPVLKGGAAPAPVTPAANAVPAAFANPDAMTGSTKPAAPPARK